MKKRLVTCLTLAILTGTSLAYGKSALDAEAVWQPAVEELDWQAIRPATIDKPWLLADAELPANTIVVKGIHAPQTKAATISIAIDQHLLPRIAQHTRVRTPWEKSVARRRIERELARSSIVLDRFQQRFVKQIGDEQHEAFCREALLLDVSKESLGRLVHPVRRDIRRGHQIRATAFGGSAIAAAFTCLVCFVMYRFLNRVTQGYYVWPIRFVTAMLMLVSFTIVAGITFSMLQAV